MRLSRSVRRDSRDANTFHRHGKRSEFALYFLMLASLAEFFGKRVHAIPSSMGSGCPCAR